MICSSVVREKTSKFSRLSPEGWAAEYRAEAPSGWGEHSTSIPNEHGPLPHEKVFITYTVLFLNHPHDSNSRILLTVVLNVTSLL
jgi:hypothetical protein